MSNAMTCPIHGIALERKSTRYGGRHSCPVDGCTVACWDGETSTPADDETRQLRRQCHATFDPLWRERTRFQKRDDAYRWLRESMGLSKADAHIGMFNRDQCIRLLELLA